MPTVSCGLYRCLFSSRATLEDFADRLNHFWTFTLLLIVACVISWKQGYNQPIRCWTPVEYTTTMTAFVDDVCWNSYTIVHPSDLQKAMRDLGIKSVPYKIPDTSLPIVGYFQLDESDYLLWTMSAKRTVYQWITVLLCFQALLFKAPNIIMYILHGYSGMNFDKLAGLTRGYENLNLHERALLCRQIGNRLYSWCKQFKHCLPWRWLTILWLLVKFLYCANIIVQLCLVDAMLKTSDPPLDNSTSYGDVIESNVLHNNASLWKSSPAFPRRVLCGFEIQQMSAVYKHSIECTLPLNAFTEFTYMLMWVWLIFVAVVTCLSLLIWLPRTLIPIFRKRYITKALEYASDTNLGSNGKADIGKFCDLIGEDGVMILKLIGANSSDLVVSDVVCSMWRMQTAEVSAQPEESQRNNSRNPPPVYDHLT